MRSFIVAAYLAAVIVFADWNPLTGVLIAALVAVWAFPILRRRSALPASVRREPARRV